MALIYNKTNWKDNDESTPINARNLNNLEDGVEYIYKKWDDIISDSTTGDHAAELIDARNAPGQNNKTLGQRLNNFDTQIKDNTNYLNNKKLDKTGIVTMGNMGQDVKEAMTGGSVAVVEGESVNINNIVPDIKKDFTEEVSVKSSVIWNDKNYIVSGDSATLGTSTSWKHTIINCSAGDRFKVTFRCQGGSSTYGLIFVDNNFKVISKDLFSTGTVKLHENYEVIIPAKATQMIINNNDVNLPISYFNLTKLEYINISSQKFVVSSLNDAFKIKDLVIEIGGLASSNGDEAERQDRCRTKHIKLKKDTIISCSDDIKFLVMKYTESLGFVSTTGFLTEKSYKINEDGIYRISYGHVNNGTISDVDYFNINSSISIPVNGYKDVEYSVIIEPDIEILNYHTSLNVVKKIQQPSGFRNDVSFVKNQLWIFDQSNDEGTDTALIRIYDFDFDTNIFTLNRNINHNLGHCNSINYCEATDTLICGNGSGDYSITGKIYIIENAYNRESIMQDDIIVIDDSENNLGSKYNVIWGESNCCEYDIAYLIVNDGKEIYKIQLGQWDNDLGRGQYKTPTVRFNGTYKILEVQSQKEYGYDYCVQGADYYNNKLVYGYGHNTGALSFKTVSFKDNEMIVDKYNIRRYTLNGYYEENTTTSITNYNGYLVVCSGGMMYFINI